MKYELRIMVFALIALFMIHNSLFIIPVYARVDPIGEARITPASPIYFLKSVREIIELKFAGTTRVRAIRELEFATRRIREVKSLAKTSRQDLIEPTLENYVVHINQLKGLVHPKDQEMMSNVNTEITIQTVALEEVFKQVSDAAAKRSIRLTIFRISEKYESSKPTACDFLAKEASSSAPIKSGSALNEVGKTVYMERAKKCQAINP